MRLDSENSGEFNLGFKALYSLHDYLNRDDTYYSAFEEGTG